MSLKVALVGGGAIAAQHLQALRRIDGLRAVAVADLNEARASALAQQYDIAAYTNYRHMIEACQPEMAIISLPHHLHREAAEYCAFRGCHMLLEKPMAMNARECTAIIEAAAAAGVQLMVGHTQQYIADNRVVKRLLRERELGELAMIVETRHTDYFAARRPDWFLDKARAGGGILMNLGAHSIDKLQWLTDSRFVQVHARLGYYGGRGDVEGNGLLLLETSRGVPVVIAQSGYDNVQRHETELLLTGGTIRLAPGQGVWLSTGNGWEEVPVDRSADPYALQLEELLLAVQGRDTIRCTGAYARSVIEVIEAAYASAESGQAQTVSRAERG
ncbi:Gfo/Idh/MocA family oxidoreductase [Paenibacillus sp. IB182496]|uniref:Gfo/Idh/MocA family oxidoreductase n=1 Tax=Paenibacillus sabuli TaxID=2772509 RepID=A0A927GPU5_9BACL|nr:Gfo/Idh/MocA family oxidoreductase [Paenibacillus sabuli]MBD2843839.1 Gfo/Idh/MocA family oxidoreductase [Paenibacillus sabuli]